MAYFPKIKSEKIVQVGDKIRFDATQSFGTPDEAAVTLVEIEPNAGDGFIDVTSTRVLDWVYLTAGSKTATVRVTTDAVYTATADISVLTEADDRLFSVDEELRMLEPDILNWLPVGYSNFNHIHRLAQKNILDWLDELRIYKQDGSRFTKADIVEKDQVRRLSLFMSLRMIFEGLSNQTDDVFAEKAARYRAMEKEAKNRNYISLDADDDGIIQADERKDNRTFILVRR